MLFQEMILNKKSSSTLRFEKFGKVQKFDICEIAARAFISYLKLALLRLHKNVSQNDFCNIVLGFHCLHLDCVLCWQSK